MLGRSCVGEDSIMDDPALLSHTEPRLEETFPPVHVNPEAHALPCVSVALIVVAHAAVA